MRRTRPTLVIVLVVGLFLAASSAYIVSETNQVVITQFGEPVGEPITEPGLHFKIPFIQNANMFEKRFLEWDGFPNQVPTRDRRFIWVDTYARWRITDPLLFFQRLRDERGAQSRLDDILDGETRNAVARHDLIEIVRTSNRDPVDTTATGLPSKSLPSLRSMLMTPNRAPVGKPSAVERSGRAWKARNRYDEPSTSSNGLSAAMLDSLRIDTSTTAFAPCLSKNVIHRIQPHPRVRLACSWLCWPLAVTARSKPKPRKARPRVARRNPRPPTGKRLSRRTPPPNEPHDRASARRNRRPPCRSTKPGART